MNMDLGTVACEVSSEKFLQVSNSAMGQVLMQYVFSDVKLQEPWT